MKTKQRLIAFSVASVICTTTLADAPSMEEMWTIIQQQQQQIQQLQSQLHSNNEKLKQTEVKVEATAVALEEGSGSVAAIAQWASKTRVGGYGELHYNNLDEGDNEIDLHRFVLFFSHQFTDSVRFFSEFEVEHSLSGEGKKGEVEMEQAYIEWDFAQNQQAKAGLFLLPIGIMNETHEPDTFYGVERNRVEAEIVPATWWEAGTAVGGEITPGLSYDLAIHSGLFMDNTARIRSGRQKGSKAVAEDLAFTGRLKYTGIAGLELGITLQHQQDIFQGQTFAGASDISATLLESHIAYLNGPFQLRALYAMWDFDEGINAVAMRDDADEREGFYIEPSLRINEHLGIFARYSEYDEVRAAATDSMKFTQIDFGLNYWLTETVVLKADYQIQEAPRSRTEADGFNLGVGWSF